ncbi:hypothetical protein ABZ499_24280 [Streptomyces sp. NPDC019990]
MPTPAADVPVRVPGQTGDVRRAAGVRHAEWVRMRTGAVAVG